MRLTFVPRFWLLRLAGLLLAALLGLSTAWAQSPAPAAADAAAPAPKARPQTGFLKRSLTVGGKSYPYRVYVPDDYQPGKAYPVVLYLHGVGDWGSDNELQIRQHGLGSVIDLYGPKQPARYGAFLAVFPQLPFPELWAGPGGEVALQVLEQTVAEFKADPRRLYLTGFSLGGYGSLHLAALHPGRFAAVAPLAGGVLVPGWAEQAFPSALLAAYKSQPLYSYAATAKALGRTPLWLFHGAQDTRDVPVGESRQMVAALKAAGHPAQYTEYPGEGHFIVDKVYLDPAFWQWLLGQKLPAGPGAASAAKAGSR